jgi:hypothetical protein
LFKGRNAPKLYKRFQGHHTQQRPDPNVREFDVDLKFHGLDIFRGSVGFNLGRRIAFEEKIVLSDLPITASLQRRSWVGKLWGYPVECWRRFTRLFSRKRRA